MFKHQDKIFKKEIFWADNFLKKVMKLEGWTLPHENLRYKEFF